MSKKQEKVKTYSPEPTITAKKHWIAYAIPSVIATAGFVLLTNQDSALKGLGAVVAVTGLIWAINKASEKLHLTDQHLILEKGLPWSKKKQEIHVHEIYKTSTEHHKLSKYFRMGHIRTRRRADDCSGFNHAFMSNHEEFSRAIQKRIQKHDSAHNLNQVFELKEKGAISAHEYNLIKLGHVTQQFLSKI
jgi:hypothetical protein